MRTVRRFHIQENGVLYPSENGMVCYYMDVERIEAKCVELESKCAELLEALSCLTAVVGLTPIKGNLEALQEAYDMARAAIAKAEGVKP